MIGAVYPLVYAFMECTWTPVPLPFTTLIVCCSSVPAYTNEVKTVHIPSSGHKHSCACSKGLNWLLGTDRIWEGMFWGEEGWQDIGTALIMEMGEYFSLFWRTRVPWEHESLTHHCCRNIKSCNIWHAHYPQLSQCGKIIPVGNWSVSFVITKIWTPFRQKWNSGKFCVGSRYCRWQWKD